MFKTSQIFHNIFINLFLIFICALVILYLQQGEINRDGVMYITQSQYLIEGNFSKALQIYNWPFYSFLIVAFTNITGLSIQYAAHGINILFFIMAVYFYLKIITILTHGKVPVFFGILTIMTAVPLMDDYLVMVIRDHGMWAGFMAGLFFYLRWSKNYSWHDAVFWQISFIFAGLFRPELFAFNLLLPFVSLYLFTKNNSFKKFLQSSSLLIFIVLIILFYFVVNSYHLDQVQLYRLSELISRPTRFISNLFQPIQYDVENKHLDYLVNDYARSFTFLFLIYVLISKWVSGLGVLHLGLFIYSIKQKVIEKLSLKILLVFLIISAVITSINLFATYVLSSRYWVMNWWVVYIFISIAAHHLWVVLSKNPRPQNRWIISFLIIMIVAQITNAFIDKYSANSEKLAGDWVKHEGIDINNIYFNDHRTAFYAGLLAYDKVDLSEAVHHYQYEYLLIRINRELDTQHVDGYKPVKVFPSDKNVKLIIYKKVNN